MARRPARKRSPLVPSLVLLAAVAGLVFVLRRDGGGIPGEGMGPPQVPAIAAATTAGRRVLFLGLDGVDWKVLARHLDAGAMPNLAGLLASGRPGLLDAEAPSLPPLVWTTMLTGVSPLEHGVLDFTRFQPRSRQREPITSEERRVPAVWNMATAGGRSVAVFGAVASWPAEPVAGTLISDLWLASRPGKAAPPEGVEPGSVERWALQVRRRVEAEVDLAVLRGYLPDLGEEEFRRAQKAREPFAEPVAGLLRVLVETRTTQALATEWIVGRSPDLAVVYLPGPALLTGLLAPRAGPGRPGGMATQADRFERVPALYLAALDRFLGEYRALAAAQGAVLMLATSPGAAGQVDDRPSPAGSTAGGVGISLLWGPGIEPGPGEEESARQVCSTLLALLGLPRGKGLYEPPLAGVAAAPTVVDYRPSFRPEATGGATLPALVRDEALARLVALGELAPGALRDGPPTSGKAASRTPASYDHEGLILRGWGEDQLAAQAFEQALALDPGQAAALWDLSDLLFGEGREPERADSLLLRAFAAGLPAGSQRVVARAQAWDARGQPARGLALLSAAIASEPNDPALRHWRGRFRLALPDCPGALADLVQAAALVPDDARILAALGRARACVGDAAGAREAIQRSLRLDPAQPELRELLAAPSVP